MSSDPSVTQWLAEFQGGNRTAAQELWQRYFQQLVHLARQRLPLRLRRVADEEDVALSAFKSFCRGVEAGRYPKLADRDDLWRLLMTITAHKAVHLVRHAQRQKRGGQQTSTGIPDPSDEVSLSQLIGQEPSPEFAAQVAEELERLLRQLKDSTLHSIALWKMEGYTNSEIAATLDCTTRTVERKLRLIRHTWEGICES